MPPSQITRRQLRPAHRYVQIGALLNQKGDSFLQTQLRRQVRCRLALSVFLVNFAKACV